ncbi:MAG TPA: hypothetical protein VHP37_15755 [Burkholderiales bacterium]|nr:hypothetical protein [Burkholderiales bacterium]
MSAFKLSPFACAAALALAACADMDWTKPGADKAAVSRDMDDCRGAWLRRAEPPEAKASQERTQPAVVSPGRPAGSANERFIAEHEAVRQCMVAKGYQLAPAR